MPWKSSEFEVLRFIKDNEIIIPSMLCNEFGYSLKYAHTRLSRLKKEKLVEDMGNTPATRRGIWCLTQRGYDKVNYLKEVKEKETNQLKREREKAYKEGYTEAKQKWAVHYNCDICNEEILVDTKEEKEAIGRYMREHGWGHARCQQKVRLSHQIIAKLPPIRGRVK